MTYASNHWPQARQHPDPIRIVAISASIAFNVAMIAVLMRPMEFTPARTGDTRIQAQLIDARPLPKLQEPLPIVKQHPQPVQPKPQPILHQRTVTPVVSQNTTPVSTAVDTNQTDITTDPVIPDIQPGPVDASLTPINSPAPTYPSIALREGITGTVELELLVGVDGRVLEARVTRSSGNHMLDNAAREQVLRGWLFKPAIRNGVAVQARGILPIAFTLDGR